MDPSPIARALAEGLDSALDEMDKYRETHPGIQYLLSIERAELFAWLSEQFD